MLEWTGLEHLICDGPVPRCVVTRSVIHVHTAEQGKGGDSKPPALLAFHLFHTKLE